MRIILSGYILDVNPKHMYRLSRRLPRGFDVDVDVDVDVTPRQVHNRATLVHVSDHRSSHSNLMKNGWGLCCLHRCDFSIFQ